MDNKQAAELEDIDPKDVIDVSVRRTIYYHPQKNELIRYHYDKRAGVGITSSGRYSVRNLLYLSQTPEEAGWIKIGLDLLPPKRFHTEVLLNRFGRYFIVIQNPCNCHPNDFMIIAADGASSMGNWKNRDEYLKWRRRMNHKKIATVKGFPGFDELKKYLKKINKSGYERFEDDQSRRNLLLFRRMSKKATVRARR